MKRLKEGVSGSRRRLFLLILLMAMFSAITAGNAFAGTVELPQTGQTICYNAGGDVITCTGTGQDGDKQAGVAWPSARFTDNNDGTVTDNLTGLVWLKNANCTDTVSGVNKNANYGKLTWANALTWTNALASGNCGLTDGSTAGEWRLPNRKELRSLVDYSKYIPALPNGHPLTNAQSDLYWSSTTVANGTDGACSVDMWVGFVDYINKASNLYVWPVRSGSGGSFYNLVISKAGTGSGTVTSNPSGINCGSTCSASFNSGTSVNLTATPASGSTFRGWSGACTGSSSTCTVTMDASKSVTATFVIDVDRSF